MLGPTDQYFHHPSFFFSVAELSRLRGLSATELEDEVMEMKTEVGQQHDSPSWSFFRVISCKDIRPPLLLLCVMHAGQQLSGINAVRYHNSSWYYCSTLVTASWCLVIIHTLAREKIKIANIPLEILGSAVVKYNHDLRVSYSPRVSCCCHTILTRD